MSRVLIFCSDITKCKDTIESSVDLVKKLKAKATILFVHEPDFFDLLDFTKSDESIDKVALKKHLQEIANEVGLEDVAIIVEIGDSANWVEIESKREKDTLIISPYEKKITNSIVNAVDIPIFILKDNKKDCKKALIATDAYEFGNTLSILDNFECSQKVAYYDTQLIPIPTLNTGVEFVGAVDIDVELYQEEIESIESNFKNFCKENNIESIFNTDEESVDVNILAKALENGVDMIVLALNSKDSMLSTYLEDIVDRATVNLFVSIK